MLLKRVLDSAKASGDRKLAKQAALALKVEVQTTGAGIVGHIIAALITGASAPALERAIAAQFSRMLPAVENGTVRTYTVYQSINEAGEIQYVGITSNFEARAAAHMAEKGITIERIQGLTELSLSDARAVEQALIEAHGLGKDGGTLLNKINSISPTTNTEYYLDSLFRGQELLNGVRYFGP